MKRGSTSRERERVRKVWKLSEGERSGHIIGKGSLRKSIRREVREMGNGRGCGKKGRGKERGKGREGGKAFLSFI